jgi:long-chain fatty acid transport protein
MVRTVVKFLSTPAAVFLWLAPCTAWAQGVVRDSVGAVSTGRGGTNIAHCDNGVIILDNPAGLANMTTPSRFDIGLDTLFTDLDYTDPQNSVDGEVVPFPLPWFAYAQKPNNGRLAYGVGLLAPAGFGATYEMNHLLYGERTYESLGALLKLLPAVAYRIDDRLSVGAAFGLAISHAQLHEPDNLQTGFLRGMPTMIDLKATGFAPTWSAGLQYILSENTTIGLSYIAETRFRMHGDVKADVSGIGIPLLSTRADTEVDLVWPASLGFGVKHRLAKKHRLSADVLWVDWSHAFDKLDLKLTNLSNPLFRALLGPKAGDRLPMDWRDSVAVRLGYEYEVTPKDVCRFGYVYHPSPIPDDTLMPLLAGTLEHAFSVGYGHDYGRWRVDVGYQYSFGATEHVSRSRIIGGDFDRSTNKAQAHWLLVAFSFY